MDTEKINNYALTYYDFVPTKKQKMYLEDSTKLKLFGGSMGSGKTIVLCADVIRLSLMYPGNRIYFCRHEYKSFKSSTLVELQNMLYGTGLIKKYNITDGEIELTNGSRILLGGLENAEKLKSLNLGAFAIDEATQTTREIFHMLVTRLRLSHIPDNRRFGLLASNPEPGWIKDDFVDPQMEGEPKPNHSFIQALPGDNPHLPKDYVSTLEKILKPLQIAKYLQGSWDVFENQVFIPDFIIKTQGQPTYQTFIMAIDPAITETDDEQLDETAICIVGIDENNIIHEVETRHGRWSFEQQLTVCKELYNFYKPDFFGVENTAYQSALKQVLNDRGIPAIPLKPDRDKVRRAYSIQYLLENKQVRINNKTLIKQMLEFPEAAKHGGHDDLVDAFVYCLIMIKKFSITAIEEKEDKYKNLDEMSKRFWKVYEQEKKKTQDFSEELNNSFI